MKSAAVFGIVLATLFTSEAHARTQAETVVITNPLMRASSDGAMASAYADPLADRGAIKAIQERLNAEGYNVGRPDGIFGSRTMKALKNAEASRGLNETEKAVLAFWENQPTARPAPPLVVKYEGNLARQGGYLAIRSVDLFSGAKSFETDDMAELIERQRVWEREVKASVEFRRVAALEIKAAFEACLEQRRQPTKDEIVDLQERLAADGFYKGKLDGRASASTMAALRVAKKAGVEPATFGRAGEVLVNGGAKSCKKDKLPEIASKPEPADELGTVGNLPADLRKAVVRHFATDERPEGWMAKVEEIRAEADDLKKARLADAFVNGGFEYYRRLTDPQGRSNDPERDSRWFREWTQTPMVSFSTDGDCRDYASAKFLLLLEAGFPAERLGQIVILPREGNASEVGESGSGFRDILHVVTTVKLSDGRTAILDQVKRENGTVTVLDRGTDPSIGRRGLLVSGGLAWARWHAPVEPLPSTMVAEKEVIGEPVLMHAAGEE